MRYGLTKNTLEQIVKIFAENSKVEGVIIFGSRAMGSCREGSDIDLAMKGKDLNVADLVKIGAELEELNLPYRFDLLVFDKIENGDVIAHIDRVGETIYERASGMVADASERN